MGNRRRIAIGLGLATLSAALFTLAFPPYDLWPLIWVGLVPIGPEEGQSGDGVSTA